MEKISSYNNSLNTELIEEDVNEENQEIEKSPKVLKENSKSILMIITIDLGNDKKDNIEIKENDDPQELAYNFITKNELDFKILPVLTDNIKKNIKDLLNEKHLDAKKEESPQYIFKNLSNVIYNKSLNITKQSNHNNISFRYNSEQNDYNNNSVDFKNELTRDNYNESQIDNRDAYLNNTIFLGNSSSYKKKISGNKQRNNEDLASFASIFLIFFNLNTKKTIKGQTITIMTEDIFQKKMRKSN